MSFSQRFIDRPIATSLVMAAIFLAGAVAFVRLPVAVLPQVDFPTVVVSATLPGGDPETMASSVAAPLERQFAQIPYLTQMTSSSSLGTTSIALQFDLDRNIDAAAQDVNAAINAASGQLPKNLPNPPHYNKTNPADPPILILGVYSDVLPIDQVDNYADVVLAQQLAQLPGVGQVSLNGEQKPAVRVQVDPAALANAGLSLEDVRSVLSQTSIDSPKGNLSGPHLSTTLTSNDQLMKASEYAKVVVAFRNGAPVHISDIGTAIDSVENNQVAGWTSHPRGITVAISRLPGANAIETVDMILARLDQIRATLPPAVHVMYLHDKTEMIRASVKDIEFTLCLTIGLVIVVIFLFLRKFWATAIAGMAVPLSLVGTFGVMSLLHYGLDNLSLMALTIAVGFVVDDAIVMLENIVRHVEEGETVYEAAVKGARQIGFTILSITVSLIAVFIPLLMMSGIVGRLFHEFAVTLSVAVLISAFVSLTLTPTMCARLLGAEKDHHGGFYDLADRFFNWMVEGYGRLLRRVLDHQGLTLLSLAATILLTGVLFVVSPKGFFPLQDTGLLIASIDAAQDISFADMVQKEREANEIILSDPAVDATSATMGAGSGTTVLNSGRVGIALKPFHERDASADQVIARLRTRLAKIPGLSVRMVSSQDITVGARASKTQFQYTLQDQDFAELNQWGKIMLDRLSKIPQIEDVTTDQEDAGQRVAIRIDRETASRLGILPQQIDDTLYDAFGQRQVTTIYTQLNQYHVILEVDPRLQEDPRALDKIYVKSANGTQVPLSAFTTFENSTAPLIISHQGQFPAVTISFNLAPGVALSQAIDLVKQEEAAAHLPGTIIPTFQGTAQAFQASLVTMPYLILAALIAVYIVLGILYESYIHPLTILSTIPSAGVGALLMLRLFNFPLDMIGLIGIILLIGIVKKNAIMMIDFALETERHTDASPRDSIYEAALLRFRPILMTTMAALFSGIPLMVMTGAGAELRRPLGFAIVGGLILSQILTLFTTPVVYLTLDRFTSRNRVSRIQKLMSVDVPNRPVSDAAE